MARLNFSTQISRKISTRTKPTKYNKSLYRNIFRDLGPGDNLSDVYYPYKYLPVGMQDVSTEDYIVIPKGRIVSLLNHYDVTEPSGIQFPASGQNIDISTSAIDSTNIVTAIDDTFWGYPEHVVGLLVPGNGGTIASGQYTSRDVTAGTLMAGGAGAVTTAQTAGPVIRPNLPIGVIAGDVYQDIRGKYLNYQLWDKAVTTITHWYIEVPYVKILTSNIGTRTIDPSTPELVGTAMTFDAMNSKYTYMTIGDTHIAKAGVPIMSDCRGNYKLENAASAIDTSTVRTSQTVGRLTALDCRYPKDLLELTDTYEGSNMPGTDTAGIPSYLFNFAHDYLVATSAAHRLADVVTAIQAGTFGGARVIITL